MYFEIADKEYNGYKYQQVNKKDLIDTIEAICRFENLRWFVLDMYDTTNIISKLAYVKDCDDGELKRLSNEEVTEILNKHDEAIILGEDYRADFSNCLIENFDFGIHDIHEMNFRGATMRFCSFALSDIRKVDFRNATFYRCKMHESTIGNCSFNEARFYNCEMDTTEYIYCDFEKASLYYSPCFESKFMCCDLSDIQDDYSYVDEKKIIWTFDSSSYENLYPTIGIGEEDW